MIDAQLPKPVPAPRHLQRPAGPRRRRRRPAARGLGYPEVAAIVEVHTRLGGRTPQPGEPISPDEVVYMADKSYRRTTRVTVEQRYAIWPNTWKDHPEKLKSLTHGERRRPYMAHRSRHADEAGRSAGAAQA